MRIELHSGSYTNGNLVFTQTARAILKKGSNNFIKAIQGATSRK